MAKSAYQLWQDDQERKKKEAAQNKAEGKINFKEASKASRVQYSLPGYEGQSKDKSYKWETDLLKPLSIKKYGRSYNDKFSNLSREQGVNENEYRRFLDFNEDKNQKGNNPRLGQGAHLQSEILDGIFKNMEANQKADIERNRNKKIYEPPKEIPSPSVPQREVAYDKKASTNNSFLDKVGGFFTGKNDIYGRPIEESQAMVKKHLGENTSASTIGKVLPGQKTDSVDRFLANIDPLGINKELAKARGDQTTLDTYYNDRKFGEGGGTDMIAKGIGYIAPASELYKGLNAAKLGLGLTKFGEKGITQRLASEAAKGAIVGNVISDAEVGVREAINPNDYNWKDNAKFIGLNTAIGAAADPLLYGAGKGIAKGFESASNRTMRNILPSNQQVEGVLRDSAKSFKAAQALPKTGGMQNPGMLQDLIPSANEIANPNFIPSLQPKTTSPMIVPKIGQTMDEILANPIPVPKIKTPEVTPPKPNKNSLLSISDVFGHLEPPVVKEAAPTPTPKPIKESAAVSEPVVLKSINPSKDVNKMSKEELQSVYQQLSEEHKALSKAKGKANKQKVQQIKDDIEQVKSLLLKLDLQRFGEAPHISEDLLPDTRGHIGTKTVKDNIGIKAAVDKTYIKTVDNLHRLNQFDSQVEQALGRELKPSERTHLLGLNSRGTDMISKQILTQNMVNKSGEVVGKSLKEITMKVPKGKLKDFEDYLINQHAITRMERGEKVFPDEMKMTSDMSRAKVKNYETSHPEFKDIAKDYYEYNKNLGQKWLVDTGILSKEEWAGYLKENPFYVPNNRVFSDLERPLFYGSKKGFANQSNPVKKATGSQRKIVSPIESTIEHTAQYIKTAKRNEVMQTLINNIKQNPEAFKDWAEIAPTEKGAGTVLDSVSNKLNEEGIMGVLEEFNKAFDQKPDLTKGNIVRGLIDGKPVHVKVHDPALLDALTNLNPKAQNVVIYAIGQVTRMMKNLTTGINPIFSLTRNIFRDIPEAYSFSKSTNNPLRFSKDLIGSLVSVMRNDELYRSFKAVGGGHSSPISSDINLLAQSKRSILPREKGVWNATKHAGGKMLGALENLNNAVEAAPRLSEFKRFAKKGDYDSVMKGLYEANDVTVNFNKHGNVTKELDAIFPYLNAAVQGLDKFGRSFFSPKASAADKAMVGVKAFSAITIPTIALYTINHNNPDYQKLSNFIKDNNFLIPNGDGTFTKIPKARELGVIFGSDVERTLRMWQEQDPQAFKDFGTYVLQMFMPPTRTIAAPFSDIRSNKNFMDAPIVPGDLQGLSPRFQYDSRTSEVSKMVGNALNVSPKQLDYLTQSYTGVLGELAIPATTKNNSVGETLKQKVTADPVFSNDLQRDFYDMKSKLDQAYNDFNKQGVESKYYDVDLRKDFSKLSKNMSDIRKEIKRIQIDPSLSAKERREQIRVLQEEINQIAASGVELAR